jgi:hypothetical protein
METWIKGIYYHLLKEKVHIGWLYMFKWSDGEITIDTTMFEQSPPTIQDAINRLMKEKIDGTIYNGRSWAK